MEFMKKFRIQSDCKISLSVHHWNLPKYNVKFERVKEVNIFL